MDRPPDQLRLLAFCPTYRLEPETAAALMYFRLQVQRGGACSFDILLTTDNPYGDGRANILHNYRKGRRMALEGGYDRILILESDIIPPKDALIKLSALLGKADVAYGLYVFRKSRVVNVYARPKAGSKVMAPGQCRNNGSSLTTKGGYERALKEGVVPCSGGGLGIVLMKREVLEKVDFRDKGKKGAHCDTYFNRDVWRAGFQQWADMSVVCGHKTPEGKILWPPHTRQDMYQAKRGFSGRGFTYGPGDEVKDERAPEWVKAGLVEEVEEEGDDLSSKTKAELYEMASKKDIAGRSNMSKAQLLKALS